MMNAPTGPSWKVTGSSKATVSAGPDAGQDADDRAEHDADERPQQVAVLQDDRESL